MKLTLATQIKDGILVVDCSGRIVFGEESSLLRDTGGCGRKTCWRVSKRCGVRNNWTKARPRCSLNSIFERRCDRSGEYPGRQPAFAIRQSTT
jgi:hypothetical protein